jgi:hypothetical protein
VEPLSDDNHIFSAHVPSSSVLDEPVSYRLFAGRRRNTPQRDLDDTRGSGRLNRLYCHDASPYVYREPFRIIEVKKWILVNQIILLEEQLRETRADLDELSG